MSKIQSFGFTAGMIENGKTLLAMPRHTTDQRITIRGAGLGLGLTLSTHVGRLNHKMRVEAIKTAVDVIKYSFGADHVACKDFFQKNQVFRKIADNLILVGGPKLAEAVPELVVANGAGPATAHQGGIDNSIKKEQQIAHP